jgi:hypothetical protein
MDDIFARYPGSHAPHIPVYSTCREGQLVEAFNSSYFWDNCRNAVFFGKAVSDCLAVSAPLFLEISCHAVLSASILAHGVPVDRVVCPMRRISAINKSSEALTEPEVFLNALGRLSLLGLNSLDLSALYGLATLKSKLIEHPLVARTIPAPKSLVPNVRRNHGLSHGPLSSSSIRIDKTTHPDLAEHIINGTESTLYNINGLIPTYIGEPILPAIGFIELVRRSDHVASQLINSVQVLEAGANFLWDVEFVSILSLSPTSPREISLEKTNASWSIITRTVCIP